VSCAKETIRYLKLLTMLNLRSFYKAHIDNITIMHDCMNCMEMDKWTCLLGSVDTTFQKKKCE